MLSNIILFLPDILLRITLRVLLFFRGRGKSNPLELHRKELEFIKDSKILPPGINSEAVNNLYQMPSAFFKAFLGPTMKYSACMFTNDDEDLGRAEVRANQLYCEKVGMRDGMSILDLGCGHGSLSLYIAKHYPQTKIVAATMSSESLSFIAKKEILNISTKVLDLASCQEEEFLNRFDVIFAIEVLEYMSNVELILKKLSGWLKKDGQLFIQNFCNHQNSVRMVIDAEHWASSIFSSGGFLPSSNLYLYFQRDLLVVGHELLSGRNYERTFNCWLKLLDENDTQVISSFSERFGPKMAPLWKRRWRFLMIALAEVFRSEQLSVSHYIMRKR
jgi:cyclopropane-fatty-acyl-phospholipid synthase